MHSVGLAAITSLALIFSPLEAVGDTCSNSALRTGLSAGLPDCRAYELVSPNYTNGVSLERHAFAPDGSSMLVVGRTGFANIESDEGFEGGVYRLSRNGLGWTPTPLALPASRYALGSPPATSSIAFYTLDLSTSFWFEREAVKPTNEIDLYSEAQNGSVTDVGPVVPPSAPSGLSAEEEAAQVELRMVGGSGDGSHLFFTLTESHWPFDATQIHRESLYEYSGAGNKEPQLVGVNEADGQGEQISDCGTVLGGGTPGNNSSMDSGHNAVSADGTIVFFTAYPTGSGCTGHGPQVAELYARVDNGEPGAHTIAISEPTREDCPECTDAGELADAHFEGASEDGSKVFFSTTQPLLGKDKSKNLYEAELGCQQELVTDCEASHEEIRLKRIIRVSEGNDEREGLVSHSTQANVQGHVVAVSQDGAYVYFIASGILAENENADGTYARPGADNLYVFEPSNEGGFRTAFIADLCSGPASSGNTSDGRCPLLTPANGNDAPMWATFNQRIPDVTPDGHFLVFTSYGDLTSDDTSSARQVFEYDAITEQLVRVSTGQNGFNDNGNTTTMNATIVSPTYTSSADEGHPTSNPSTYWSHLSVSTDGSYVFFQSGNGLTPQAVNQDQVSKSFEGPIYAENIYEYHSINGNIADGGVYLISDGKDVHTTGGEGTVELLGTDGSGNDIIFTTLDQLVPQDTNEEVDIYDARVDGGYSPPTPPSTCFNDECEMLSTNVPTLLAPGSEFQVGSTSPPVLPSAPTVKATIKNKPKTRTRDFSNALAACRKRPPSKRAGCEKNARRRYKLVIKHEMKTSTAGKYDAKS